jgi:hypothetical protein
MSTDFSRLEPLIRVQQTTRYGAGDPLLQVQVSLHAFPATRLTALVAPVAPAPDDPDAVWSVLLGLQEGTATALVHLHGLDTLRQLQALLTTLLAEADRPPGDPETAGWDPKDFDPDVIY